MSAEYECGVCGKTQAWSTEYAAECAASWHVWIVHRAHFLATHGHPIGVPRPEAVGKRL